MQTLEADYVVVGAGCMGMAFADTILHETNASVVMVDRHGRPGGHWTQAYPFVRLHQPSAFYGVNSTALGDNQKDVLGANAGLYELASSAEVCAYFERVMRRQMLPSGRVTYLPLTDYTGDGIARSLTTGEQMRLLARRRIVDATYMNVVVPAMRPPPFEVADGVRCVPLNALGTAHSAAENYVVIGAGKSGMDACLWLLANGLAPDRIEWIVPRDSWLLDRAHIQFVGDLWEESAIGRSELVEVCARANTLEDLFVRLEACGQLMRLHPDVTPTMYRCATVTRYEVDQLRRIDNIVRLGRLHRIEPQRMFLEHGELAVDASTLFVDCTADGLPRRAPKPVFADAHITLQTVRPCQQAFSAAFIAHVETQPDDDARKNAICQVVPHPDSERDWLRSTLGILLNSAAWMRDDGLREWLESSRLAGASRASALEAGGSVRYQESRQRAREFTGPAIKNLQQLLQ
jgi:hypothetical protein